MKKREIADKVSADVDSGLDRFDLEQEIMSCWNVLDDMKLTAKTESGVDVAVYMESLATVYDVKFHKLFDTFSTLVHEGKIV
jgi:hypothetical protein